MSVLRPVWLSVRVLKLELAPRLVLGWVLAAVLAWASVVVSVVRPVLVARSAEGPSSAAVPVWVVWLESAGLPD